jgi:hypothetical protein
VDHFEVLHQVEARIVERSVGIDRGIPDAGQGFLLPGHLGLDGLEIALDDPLDTDDDFFGEPELVNVLPAVDPAENRREHARFDLAEVVGSEFLAGLEEGLGFRSLETFRLDSLVHAGVGADDAFPDERFGHFALAGVDPAVEIGPEVLSDIPLSVAYARQKKGDDEKTMDEQARR